MPPPRKINLLPAELRGWLQEELRQRGFGQYEDLAEALNFRLEGAGLDLRIQKSAIYARSLEGCAMKALGSNGAEAALILFPPHAKHDQLSDLSAQSAVLVDTIGSGTDLFWHTIVRIEQGEDGSKDDWSNARVVNDPLELANVSAEMGEIDAVILVRKVDSPDVKNLLGQGWSLGELWDRDIDDLEFNGLPLYQSVKQSVAQQGSKNVTAWGYEVRSLVTVRRSFAEGDRMRFATITAATQ